jgi:acyl-CoA thioester hydrolase
VQVRYRAPARFDDQIVIEPRITEVRSCSLRFDYQIRREGRLLAEGMTRLASVNAQHTLQRFPPDVIAILASGEAP